MGPSKNMITRRTVLVAGAASLAAAHVRAQGTWPDRPIRLIVPFPPGGSNDILSRALAEKLGPRLGQSIVIENKGGAGGTLGTDFVAKAPPDGNTLLFASGSITTNVAAGKKLPYDLMGDFEPIGMIASGPYVVVVSSDSKMTTLREFIDLARAKPDTISYGSAGTGSLSHLGPELLAAEANLKLVHVPYKGTGPAFIDLMGGNLQMVLPTLTSMIPHLRAGKMRSLAVTSPQRAPQAPEVPTTAEAGLPGFQLEVWWGLLAPAKVPPAILKRLNEELNAVLASPEMREVFTREGVRPRPSTPDEFRNTIRSDIGRWRTLIKDRNIVIE